MNRGLARRTSRERLLDAADELFYADGIRTVGIDRVIAHAGVAKASLYKSFGSKDELIRAYLEDRGERWRTHLAMQLDRGFQTPRERLLGVFELLGGAVSGSGYVGCPFIKASAEAKPGSAVRQATDAHRQWVRDLLLDLSQAAGAKRPTELAGQLALLYHGALVAAHLDADADAAGPARAAAEVLVAHAVGEDR